MKDLITLTEAQDRFRSELLEKFHSLGAERILICLRPPASEYYSRKAPIRTSDFELDSELIFSNSVTEYNLRSVIAAASKLLYFKIDFVANDGTGKVLETLHGASLSSKMGLFNDSIVRDLVIDEVLSFEDARLVQAKSSELQNSSRRV